MLLFVLALIIVLKIDYQEGQPLPSKRKMIAVNISLLVINNTNAIYCNTLSEMVTC